MNSTSITILKRPNDKDIKEQRNEASRNKSLEAKTLEQKKADYAAARLRILGSNSEIKLDKEESTVNVKKSPSCSSASSLSSSSSATSSPIKLSLSDSEKINEIKNNLDSVSILDEDRSAGARPRLSNSSDKVHMKKPFKIKNNNQQQLIQPQYSSSCMPMVAATCGGTGVGPRIPITMRPPPTFIDNSIMLQQGANVGMFTPSFPPIFAYPLYPTYQYVRKDEQNSKR